MLDELWKQVLTAALVAFGSFLPWALGRYRDRRAQETEKDALRARARLAIDITSAALSLVERFLIVANGNKDEQLQREHARISKMYLDLLKEYQDAAD